LIRTRLIAPNDLDVPSCSDIYMWFSHSVLGIGERDIVMSMTVCLSVSNKTTRPNFIEYYVHVDCCGCDLVIL